MRLKSRASVSSWRRSSVLGRRLGRAHLLDVEVVGAEALLHAAAVDHRIGETGEVAGGLPHARVLQDRGVQGDDVVALLQHRAPPLVLDVRLQQHAVMAVVIRRAEPAVDLRRGEDEPAPLAQRDDLFHGGGVGHRRAMLDNGSPVPFYEYKRQDGTTFEIMQKMVDPPLECDPRRACRSRACSIRSPCTSRARASTTPTTGRRSARERRMRTTARRRRARRATRRAVTPRRASRSPTPPRPRRSPRRRRESASPSSSTSYLGLQARQDLSRPLTRRGSGAPSPA